MTAYDEKNNTEFNDVTESINEALIKMHNDRSIKCSISSLAKLASVHRNTIRNRVWPLERVAAIKAARKAELDEKRNNVIEVDPTVELKENIRKCLKEIQYWHGKSNEFKSLYESMNVQFVNMSKSKKFYMNQVDKLQVELEKANAEISRITDLLNMVNDK
ncbi:hypothetical protein [Aeromonas hydrophila]|uniref:hypothetical protein n=1 Tax=Aeromonas hydrophila TaxID=644 RepID=UPI00235ED3CF|nr:hypothetical protein [Aeromonas hydrophila]